MLLEEVKKNTELIFAPSEENGEKLSLPEPSPHWQRKIEALEEASLWRQRQAAIFDMRCEQADTMGFQKLTSDEMVVMIMGEEHTHDEEGQRQSYEWFYNHHTDKTETTDCKWGGSVEDFIKMEKKNRWFLSPFSETEKWRCRFGKLDHLKQEIPYGVVLKMQELKKLNLFNVFNILAPIEAWERETDIDPIVVATIWEITDKENESPEKLNAAGQVAHYFLAQW